MESCQRLSFSKVVPYCSYSVIINLTLWRRHGIYIWESICLCDRLPLLPARRWFFGVCLHAAAAPQTQLSPAIKLKLPTASINNNVLINNFSRFPRWLETNSRVYFAICHQKLITIAAAVAMQKFPLTQSNRDYLCSTRLDPLFWPQFCLRSFSRFFLVLYNQKSIYSTHTKAKYTNCKSLNTREDYTRTPSSVVLMWSTI